MSASAVRIPITSSTVLRLELNLPDSWIGRFEMMGGGGTDGSVGSPQGSAGTELSQGWAVAADDGGP